MNEATKKLDIYWDDLTEECQKKIQEFFDGCIENYDTFPIGTLYKFEKKE